MSVADASFENVSIGWNIADLAIPIFANTGQTPAFNGARPDDHVINPPLRSPARDLSVSTLPAAGGEKIRTDREPHPSGSVYLSNVFQPNGTRYQPQERGS
jgi:hypothetical protein